MVIPVDDDIVLQPPEETDAEELYRLIDRNRAYLRQWLPWLDMEQSPADTLRFIRFVRDQQLRNESLNLCIRYRGALCGVIGFHRFDWVNRATSVGYWLAEDFQGKGIMIRSCKAMVDFAFRNFMFHRVEIRCATGNLKSRAIPERLGFREEGMIREAEWLYDHFVDLIVYGMLSPEWQPPKAHSIK